MKKIKLQSAKETVLEKRSCLNCNKYKDCEFRKTGESCGN